MSRLIFFLSNVCVYIINGKTHQRERERYYSRDEARDDRRENHVTAWTPQRDVQRNVKSDMWGAISGETRDENVTVLKMIASRW